MRNTGWLLLAASGCALEDRFLLQVPVLAGGHGADVLDAGSGAEVWLTEAQITFSDLRLEEPARDTLASALARAVGGPVAWAHPGHDYPGDVAGELLGTFTVDLLGPDQSLGVAPCYEGEYATARVSLQGSAALLAGTYADTSGQTVPFRFEIEAEQDIAGIPFDELLGPDTPELALRFDPHEALRHTDWSSPDTDGDGVLTLADEIYHNTVPFGVVATTTWSVAREGR
jgi:hypothetical protein